MDLDSIVTNAINASRDPLRARKIITDLRGILGTERGDVDYRPPGVYVLNEDRYLVIGDLHGDFYSGYTILREYYNEIARGRTSAIFLGDYVDRGYAQLETILMVSLMKLAYPDNVIMLRGNHEPPEWLTPSPHDFPDVLISRFGAEGRRLYSEFQELFDKLPLIAYMRGEFAAFHGGPPVSVLSAPSAERALYLGEGEFPPEEVETILWSDPVDIEVLYTVSPRGAGILYGRKFVREALSKLSVRKLLRSHEPVNGVRLVGDAVYTIFSAPLVYELPNAGVLRVERDITGFKYVEELIVPISPA